MAEAVQAFNEAAGEVGAEISPLLRNGGDYAQGFTCALGKNVSYNLVSGVCQDDLMSGNKANYWGKTSGDVITMIGGGSLAIGSGAADVGLVFTGVGTVAVPAVTGAMIQGGVVAGVSFHNLKQDAQILFAKDSSISGKDTLNPGNYAGESVPARGKGRDSPRNEER